MLEGCQRKLFEFSSKKCRVLCIFAKNYFKSSQLNSSLLKAVVGRLKEKDKRQNEQHQCGQKPGMEDLIDLLREGRLKM